MLTVPDNHSCHQNNVFAMVTKGFHTFLLISLKHTTKNDNFVYYVKKRNPVSLLCLCEGMACQRCFVSFDSGVYNGEDVQVKGQTRGACICLAIAQKCLAFHTTPLGSQGLSSAKSLWKTERTRKERKPKEDGGWRVGVMEREQEEKNELDDTREQKER